LEPGGGMVVGLFRDHVVIEGGSRRSRPSQLIPGVLRTDTGGATSQRAKAALEDD
jgi:hypothetical protein